MRERWIRFWTDHLHERLITQAEALEMARTLAAIKYDAHAALSYAIDGTPKTPESLSRGAQYAVESLIRALRGAQ